MPLIVGVIYVLVILGGSPVTGATTTVSVSGFVAVTNGTGSLQIMQFALDGSHERRLTTGPANHHYPSLSPDGAHLLYTGSDSGSEEIYELDLARPDDPIAITSPPMVAASASWSPDSKFIVFSGLRPGEKAFQIFRANPDGSSAIQLTHSVDTGNTQPVVSPDALHIAFINGGPSTVAGPFGSTIDIQSSSIWVMSSNGDDIAQLTPGPLDAYPAWQDDHTLLFARADGLARGSSVLSVSLAGTVSPQSPTGEFLVEPRPLPGGSRYGATLVIGRSTQLVIVSRATSGFAVARIEVPAHDGNATSISWLLAPPASASTGGIHIDTRWALAVEGIALAAVIVAVVLLVRRGRRRSA